MQEFFKDYKIPIIFAIVGLILAISFISFGFFKTMLIVICTGLGATLGVYLKQAGYFDNFGN